MAWAIDRRLTQAGPAVTAVAVNAAVFVLLRIAAAVAGDGVLRWVEMPSGIGLLLSRPWTVLTYMVSQYDFFHLAVNMIWLWCFGRFLADIMPPRRWWKLYIAGGLGGAAVFATACDLLPSLSGTTHWLIGSSASVIAIVAATAILMPRLEVQLFMIGPLQLRWVAWITIALDLTGLFGVHPGAHFAHAGGLIAGGAYALYLRRKPVHHPDGTDDRTRLDVLLDKVRRSGLGSLSMDERRELMRLSERLRP
ncbi:MAG: rhomboid family intramembrane serine protease [Duncaniella sp.]|nr:rhomboid family intramembrane serine protease [Duncaniella sp.]